MFTATVPEGVSENEQVDESLLELPLFKFANAQYPIIDEFVAKFTVPLGAPKGYEEGWMPVTVESQVTVAFCSV